MTTSNQAQNNLTDTLNLLLRQFNNRVILSLDDLSAATGLSKSTIYKRTHLLRRGKKNIDLPRLSLSENGRLIQINVIDLAEWLDKKRGKSPSVPNRRKKGRPTKAYQVSTRKNHG